MRFDNLYKQMLTLYENSNDTFLGYHCRHSEWDDKNSGIILQAPGHADRYQQYSYVTNYYMELIENLNYNHRTELDKLLKKNGVEDGIYSNPNELQYDKDNEKFLSYANIVEEFLDRKGYRWIFCTTDNPVDEYVDDMYGDLCYKVFGNKRELFIANDSSGPERSFYIFWNINNKEESKPKLIPYIEDEESDKIENEKYEDEEDSLDALLKWKSEF